MTREEAIKRLSKYVNNGFYTIEHQETCAMAIAALREQEERSKAESEGRVIVLPAKVGDTVYTIAFENCLGGKCFWLKDGKCVKAASPEYCPQEVIEQTFGLSFITLGISVYATREEAETAMRRRLENV